MRNMMATIENQTFARPFGQRGDMLWMLHRTVLIMLAAVVIIWGGLAVSITALISRGRREDRDARAEASARAREHMLNPEQVD